MAIKYIVLFVETNLRGVSTNKTINSTTLAVIQILESTTARGHT